MNTGIYLEEMEKWHPETREALRVEPRGALFGSVDFTYVMKLVAIANDDCIWITAIYKNVNK